MGILSKLFGKEKKLTPDEEEVIDKTEKQAYYEEAQRLARMKGVRRARKELDS